MTRNISGNILGTNNVSMSKPYTWLLGKYVSQPVLTLLCCLLTWRKVTETITAWKPLYIRSLSHYRPRSREIVHLVASVHPSVRLRGFTQGTLYTTTTVYGVLVHQEGAICTTVHKGDHVFWPWFLSLYPKKAGFVKPKLKPASAHVCQWPERTHQCSGVFIFLMKSMW